MATNIDSLQKYKNIYYILMENEMPILKGGERKKKARRTQQFKNATFVGLFAFFLFYKRIGILNRLMFCLLSS